MKSNWSASPDPGVVEERAGEVVVGTGQGLVRVTRLQLEGRRAVSADEFLRGYPGIVGDRLPS